MNLFILYLLLLKATMTTFSGLSSIPIIHEDLVVERKVLTDRQLNAAVVAGRTVPGANGLYVVSVGYMAAGPGGAFVGWLAMTTPAFVIIALLAGLANHAQKPLIQNMIHAVIVAAAALICLALIPLARDALLGPLTMAIAISSALFVIFTKRDTLWVIAGSALAGAIGYFIQ